MRAEVGDRIIIEGHHLGEPRRECVVLEVHGEGGVAPFMVRWEADGHTGLFYPGSDASVVHHDASSV